MKTCPGERGLATQLKAERVRKFTEETWGEMRELLIRFSWVKSWADWTPVHEANLALLKRIAQCEKGDK